MAFDYKKMLKREHNVGAKERQYRMIGGAVLLLLSVVMGNIFLLLIGGVLVATAFMRWCPVYSGMSRSSVEPNEPTEDAGGSH